MTKKNLIVGGFVFALTLSAVTSGFIYSSSSVLAGQNVSTETELNAEANSKVINLHNTEEMQSDYVRIIEDAPDYSTADKDTIFHMMLNSIDYYDKVSGTMIFTSDNVNVVNVVEFQSVLSEETSYSRFTQCSTNYTGKLNLSNKLNSINMDVPKFEDIVFCKDGKKIDILPNDKTYSCLDNSVMTLDDALPIKDEERISVAEDGMPLYRFRNDPTNVLMSSMCLFPQDIAFGFLEDQDLWEIKGIVDNAGLRCYEICGKTTPEYGAKLNVATFDFLVDTNTGVLVKYEGFDENGNLSDFIYTENLKFDDVADPVSELSENFIEGYSEVSPY